MKATRLNLYFAIILMAAALMFAAGCSDDDDNATDSTVSIHTIHLANGGSNTTQCTARQFTYLELTPADDPANVIKYSYSSNPNTSMDLGITIPKTGFYKVAFYLYDGGPGIWWNSINLAVGQTTEATLSTINTGFYDNSYVAGIRSDGNDIPCN